MSEPLHGACLCGAVAYEVDGPPESASFCHCRMCQRASGAPVVAWGTWPAQRLRLLQGEPKAFHSSPGNERRFCPACGAQLFIFSEDQPGLVDVNLACLDDPGQVAPQYHIWCMSRISWLETADGLPRNDDGWPDRPAKSSS